MLRLQADTTTSGLYQPLLQRGLLRQSQHHTGTGQSRILGLATWPRACLSHLGRLRPCIDQAGGYAGQVCSMASQSSSHPRDTVPDSQLGSRGSFWLKPVEVSVYSRLAQAREEPGGGEPLRTWGTGSSKEGLDPSRPRPGAGSSSQERSCELSSRLIHLCMSLTPQDPATFSQSPTLGVPQTWGVHLPATGGSPGSDVCTQQQVAWG